MQTARQDVRSLAETVKERTSGLTGEISEQGRSLVEDTRYQFQSQAQSGVERVASGLRGFGEQAQALAEGRPEEAPQLVEYLNRAADGIYGAADRLFSVADDVQTRGVTGVIDDVQQYARRRPGTFLLGAALLGFGIGRFVKAEKARAEQDDADEQQRVITTNGNRRRPLAAGSAAGAGQAGGRR